MSAATAEDLDEVVDLVEAIQAVANDESVAIYVADYDHFLDEYLLRFDYSGQTHEAWFTSPFIAQVFGEIAPPRFLVA